jgi:hypothetical protein
VGKYLRLLLLLALVLLGYLTYHKLSSLFALPGCSYDLLRSELSPRKHSKVSVYEVNCGATTGFVYLLTVSAFGRSVDPSQEYFFSKTGRDDIRVAWNGEDRIIIEHGNTGRILRKAVVWNTYQIDYKP